jgi:hypothetical protein
VDRESVGTISCEGLEDGIGGLGPDKRLRVVVVHLNEGCDVSLQFADAAMDAALDLLVGEQREPAFDLVQPGGARRGEVQVIVRVTGQPGSDRRGFVGGIVVEHHTLDKTAAPLADGLRRHSFARRDRLVAQTGSAINLRDRTTRPDLPPPPPAATPPSN